nr:hypothetical protein GCM10020063_037240 [Dactylosporangium thailandense]
MNRSAQPRPLRAGGDGPLVAFVHGMEDGWESWMPLAERLPAGWRAVALDLPWRSGNDYRWRHTTAADWVGRGLAALDEPVAVLVGHSLGATAVLGLLAGPQAPATAPDARAVLLAPFYRPPEVPVSWAVFERCRREFDAIVTQGLGPRLGPRAALLDPDLRELIVAKMVERIGPIGFLTLFEHFLATAELPLGSVRTPALVLAGKADPCLAGGRAEALARRMPAATVRIRPHYDHFCHVAQAADVAGELLGFVADPAWEETSA